MFSLSLSFHLDGWLHREGVEGQVRSILRVGRNNYTCIDIYLCTYVQRLHEEVL